MPIAFTRIRNPKRKFEKKGARSDWFPYYAGFSVGFVEDTIDYLDLPRGSILLDPWVGAGSTAEASTNSGLQVKGYDVNPAVLFVAQAKTLSARSCELLPQITPRIVQAYERSLSNSNRGTLGHNDPLEQWLYPTSASRLRRLERILEPTINRRQSTSEVPIWRRPGSVPPMTAFFYVALFRTLRHFTSRFQSSNPTWIKVPHAYERLHVSDTAIIRQFSDEVAKLCQLISFEKRLASKFTKRTFSQASSLRLPLVSNSIDAVISSPPYCTRIDYVKATLPELAVIGHPNGDRIRAMREQMIGTPAITGNHKYDHRGWGPTCSRFLAAVAAHPSKASRTYYSKYYLQYFDSIFASLHEIDRVLKKDGRCVLVVQDSYYKEIRNDLPRIFVEMTESLQWRMKDRKVFRVSQTLAGVNPRVKRYRNSFTATESALLFSK